MNIAPFPNCLINIFESSSLVASRAVSVISFSSPVIMSSNDSEDSLLATSVIALPKDSNPESKKRHDTHCNEHENEEDCARV